MGGGGFLTRAGDGNVYPSRYAKSVVQTVSQHVVWKVSELVYLLFTMRKKEVPPIGDNCTIGTVVVAWDPCSCSSLVPLDTRLAFN